MAIVNLDKEKEYQILSVMARTKTIKEIVKDSGVPDKTVRIYLKQMESLNKVRSSKTYPITYRRIARKEWAPEAKEETKIEISKGLTARPEVVDTLVNLFTDDSEVTNPILIAIKESMGDVRKGELTLDALKLFVAECSLALNKLDRI